MLALTSEGHRKIIRKQSPETGIKNNIRNIRKKNCHKPLPETFKLCPNISVNILCRHSAHNSATFQVKTAADFFTIIHLHTLAVGDRKIITTETWHLVPFSCFKNETKISINCDIYQGHG
jgi:hypothetical protein